ncbi:MAG: ribosome-associated toxin RatA of RatAB toxin-antitoxin module [Gammaproteobacteria bacterium]|jgi:ribosome-associated toxin RatA of RatAB toxin-antitoxin module
MFDIVNDVASYPAFLPWCGEVKIVSQSEQVMEASILMKKGRLNHWFSTRNKMLVGEKIEMTLIDGPFKSLDGVWEFIAFDETSSKVKLDLNFEFSSGITTLLLSPIFTQIANSMVDSFCTRAHELNRL